MRSMEIILIITAIVVYAYYWYTQNIQIHALKKKRVKKTKPNLKRVITSKPAFRSVVIKVGMHACQSAQDLDNQSILMTEASALPLGSCDADKCNCRYLRYDDRRRDAHRNSAFFPEQTIQDDIQSKHDLRM